MGTDGHDKDNKNFAPVCEPAKSCTNTVLLQDTAVGHSFGVELCYGIITCYYGTYDLLTVNAEMPGKNK